MTEPKRLTAAELQAAFLRSPFIGFLRLEGVAIEADGAITARLPLRPELERGAGTGQYHGGPIASLIDIVGDLAVAAAVGGGVPTINFRTDFLKPAIGPVLVARGIARRVGRTIAVADVDVTDEKGALVAHAAPINHGMVLPSIPVVLPKTSLH